MNKCKNENEKVRKTNARMYEKKSEGSGKLHTSSKRTYCAYTKKNDCLKNLALNVFFAFGLAIMNNEV